MDHLMFSIKKRFFAALILLTIFLFLIVFLPMRAQLKNQAVENYNLIAESKLQIVTELVNASLSGARSLSGRTAIRDHMVRHIDEGMTWSALADRTYVEYLDGLKPIQNLEVAIRYVEGKPLFVHNLTDEESRNYTSLFSSKMEMQYAFQVRQGQTELIAYSPIVSDNRLIGSDIIVTNVTDQVRELEKDGFCVKILEPNDAMLQKLTPGRMYEELSLDDESYACVIKEINENSLLFVGKLSREVFWGVNEVSMLSMIGFALGLAFIFFLLHVSLVKLANGTIQEIKGSRDTYMNYANYDALTGAYTRVFFENWMENIENGESAESRDETLPNSKYVIAMIDIDRFKWINDTFGHKVGDEVLKFIADVLIQTLRENDFVFRFGGDEFIVVFEDVSTDRVLKILSRIQKAMRDANPFEFEIQMSYGVEAVESLDNIYESMHDTIEKADRKMYHSKKKNRSNAGAMPPSENRIDAVVNNLKP